MAKYLPATASAAMITAGGESIDAILDDGNFLITLDAANAGQITAGATAIGLLSDPSDAEAAEAAYNAMVATDVSAPTADDLAEPAYADMYTAAGDIDTSDLSAFAALLRINLMERPLRPDTADRIVVALNLLDAAIAELDD
jgi:hypothetical protein